MNRRPHWAQGSSNTQGSQRSVFGWSPEHPAPPHQMPSALPLRQMRSVVLMTDEMRQIPPAPNGQSHTLPRAHVTGLAAVCAQVCRVQHLFHRMRAVGPVQALQAPGAMIRSGPTPTPSGHKEPSHPKVLLRRQSSLHLRGCPRGPGRTRNPVSQLS